MLLFQSLSPLVKLFEVRPLGRKFDDPLKKDGSSKEKEEGVTRQICAPRWLAEPFSVDFLGSEW